MSLSDEIQPVVRLLQQDTFGPLLRVWDRTSFAQFAQLVPWLWEEIGRQSGTPLRIMVSSLEPNQTVAPHVDTYQGTRRHLPLTAPVFWWDEDGGARILASGVWTEVDARVTHSVRNPTDVRRVTLIVDFSE